MKDAIERSRVIRFADARASIPGPSGENAVLVLQRGTLDVKLSRPLRPNVQSPHEQDEIYVVVAGSGCLEHGGARDAFGPGDLLFVAAGVEHRFADFDDDLVVWRVFYGPRGGELPTGGAS